MAYHVVIGLETHVQLNTVTKLFCNCLNEYTPNDPNKNICELCTGQPGALPLLNKEAVKKAIKLGVALGSTIPEITRWDRKNYFYPDNPTGYQISQFDHPIVAGGEMPIVIENKKTGEYTDSKVEITRAHLESDAAKLIHAAGKTMVDFNRCGAPLIEIVTEPCIYSKEQAMAYITDLQLLVRKIGISNADMEKGQMRFDVNISLRNDEQLSKNELANYRVEIKNVNSVRSVGRAIEYEIKRQEQILNAGGVPDQETRGWDDDKGISTLQRSKEDAMDYRYFPEPDILPLRISREDIPNIDNLPQLPWVQRSNYLDQGLSEQVANTFVKQESVGNLYDTVVSQKGANKNSKTVANIISGTLIAELEDNENKKISDLVSSQNILVLAKMFDAKEINNKGLSKAIKFLIKNPKEQAEEVVVSQGLIQVSDDSVLEPIVEVVIESHPEPVADFKGGKVQALGFLIGMCMKESKGQGNPQKFGDMIKAKLGEG